MYLTYMIHHDTIKYEVLYYFTSYITLYNRDKKVTWCRVVSATLITRLGGNSEPRSICKHHEACIAQDINMPADRANLRVI